MNAFEAAEKILKEKPPSAKGEMLVAVVCSRCGTRNEQYKKTCYQCDSPLSTPKPRAAISSTISSIPKTSVWAEPEKSSSQNQYISSGGSEPKGMPEWAIWGLIIFALCTCGYFIVNLFS